MKNKKSKIWLYYCKKLSKQPVITLFYLLYSLFLMREVFSIVERIKYSQNGQEYLLNFGFISLFQFGSLFMTTSHLVSKIVKPIVKKGDGDDVKISLFTPGINREAIIFNKYKAIATYFFLINLLFLTLPVFFYFFSLSLTLTAFSFLLLNGLVFALVNFLFIVPLFFGTSESYSNFFVYFFLFYSFILSDF